MRSKATAKTPASARARPPRSNLADALDDSLDDLGEDTSTVQLREDLDAAHEYRQKGEHLFGLLIKLTDPLNISRKKHAEFFLQLT